MEELEKQNQRLKELAMFLDENKEIVVTGANVIGENPASKFKYTTID